MNIANEEGFFIIRVKTALPSFDWYVGITKHEDKFSLSLELTAPSEKWREVYLIDMFEWGRADGSSVELGDWAISSLISWRLGLVGALNYYQENLLTG